MIYTIAVHESLIEAANQRAAALGAGLQDAQTFGAAVWHNAAGAAFAVACFSAPPGWIAALSSAPVRPAWDMDEVIDLAGASAAIAALDLPDLESGAVPAATAGRIAVARGLDAAEALAALGLFYPVEAG